VGAAVVLLQTLLYTAGLEGLAAARYRPRYAARPPPQQISEHVAFLQHPLFGHVPNPLFRGNGVGPAGFRGPQPESPKPDGEVRIACVGDSIVWGWMVPDDGSYPVRLQRELDADPGPPGRIRVFNAGVPSYDSRHVLRTLEARVLPYAPDVVVVTVGWNDLAQAYGAGWRAFPPNPAPVPGFDPATAQWIRALLPPASRTPRPHPGALEQFRANLVRIVESVRAAGSVALLTNLPTIVSGSDTTDDEWRRARRRLDFQLGHLQLFQDVIDETCARTPGVRCALDVFPTSEHGKGRYFFDHCHPTEAGHAIMARRIASALRAQGLPGGVR
jgi:lysophospholipase L1-like esterase